MKLAHIALYVLDLEGMKAFYTRHFGAQVGNKYHNPRTGLQTYFLYFDEGSALEIMCRPGVENGIEQPALGYTHIAFSLGSQDAVDTKTQELVSAGCKLTGGPRVTGDGYYESSLLDPEGNPIELVA